MFVCSFTVCTHNFWKLFRHSLFFLPSHMPCTSPSLHPNTSPKWLTLIFSNCIRDVIQVEQKCCACLQKWYTSILLTLTILIGSLIWPWHTIPKFNVKLFYLSTIISLSEKAKCSHTDTLNAFAPLFVSIADTDTETYSSFFCFNYSQMIIFSLSGYFLDHKFTKVSNSLTKALTLSLMNVLIFA